MTVGERIAKARGAMRPGGWSQRDLAKELAARGCMELNETRWLTRIKNYESLPPRTVPSPEIEHFIEDALNLERGWLQSDVQPVRWRSSQSNVESTTGVQPRTINLIPYWGMVPCGTWERPDVEDEQLIQVSDRIEDPRGMIAVRVRGNSMLPRFQPGEIVTVRLDPEKVDGVVTLAKNQDGELTLKLMRHVAGNWELHSINPDYGIASAEGVTVLGHAVYHEGGDSSGLRA